MGQGNYDEEKCPGCRKMVSGLVWVQQLHKSVCWSCFGVFQQNNPLYRSQDAKERMDKAHELYLREKDEYEKLVAEGK